MDFEGFDFPFLLCAVFLAEGNKARQLLSLEREHHLQKEQAYSDVLEHFEGPGIENKISAVEPGGYNHVPLFSVFHCPRFGHQHFIR